jgi:threonine synthase
VRYRCECGGILDVVFTPAAGAPNKTELLKQFQQAQIDANPFQSTGATLSGVWRFRHFLPPFRDSDIVSHPEGNTRLYSRLALSAYCGVDQALFKHEGENPTGSFKDRGMTAAVSHAKAQGFSAIACASTGNTSASLAAYAGQAGLKAIVFLPAGKISHGKLAQAVAYGARCIPIVGDFDSAMQLVEAAAKELNIYLANSLNPYRLEGQKTIIWELLLQLGFNSPDWIVVPGGNLGNTSAFGKALRQAKEWGWIDKVPKLATIQAAGASPFVKAYSGKFSQLTAETPKTIATAIQIGNPVNYPKAVAAINYTNGIVTAVTDAEIMAAKAAIDHCGIGCEPASAATLAGIKQLKGAGTIKATDRVVAILTGNILKDSDCIDIPKLEAIEPNLHSLKRLLT